MLQSTISLRLLLVSSLILGSGTAQADTITFNFSGEIVNDFVAPVPGVEIGTVFTGSFSYDDSLPETIVGPKTSSYAPASLEINFTSPSNVQSTLSINNAQVRIDNDNASDVFQVQAGSTFGIPFSFNGRSVQQATVFFIDNSAVIYNDTSLPFTLSLGDFDVTELLLLTDDDPGQPSPNGRYSSTGRIESLEMDSAPSISCSGFDSPVGDTAVTVKMNRAVPFKARIQDENLQYIDDLGLTAPPVIQVTFIPNGGGDAVDVTDDALPAGAGTEGNEFEFINDQWQFNLKIKNYTAAGTYEVEMVSGDDSEYVIEPSCTGTFVVDN